ncbi:hypothetical protein JRI60_14040 [Archangium violaceum]|uniref:hypothetical protein n=1 Tax=Archangium violaceum TaxID=83451 RepID=UPI00195200B8|nr:hypothetical protein [Archangium violaceum]QRO00057.1 hypothetical protein JRI60_14040 [Archangium violaceum]
MDVYQQLDTQVATKNLGTEWLSSGAYYRLATSTYGNVVFGNPQVQTIRSYGQRTPHALIATPQQNPNVWIVGWEDQNAGGNRTFNDSVILIKKVPPSP